jgi:hypothetical protein
MGKYDHLVINPPHLRLTMKSDNTMFFDGLMVNAQNLGYDFTFGHQFVRKPFKGTNPEDPNDFQAEIVFFFGPELEKHVFTKPTIVSLPAGLPHHPFEVTRVDKPIIQIEIMIHNKGVHVEPYFQKDKNYNIATMVNRQYL